MTFTVTPHLNFRGQARDALAFYRAAFGGEQVLVTYGQARQGAPDEAEWIMWGQVESPDGFRLMAFDILASRPYDPGTHAFFVAVQGTSSEEVRARWQALSSDATILHPLGPAPWSSLYGMLTDRFGVTWIVSLGPGADERP